MSEWISVKDRLPDVGDDVIIAVRWRADSDGFRWHRGAFSTPGRLSSYWEWITEDGYDVVDDDCEVTHWMPLPEPPESEVKNERS